MSRLHLGRVDPTRDYALDPAQLRTHGVVVGMTGSGKTGFCLVLLEELVRAGVPVIAIDPKGDLANLGLVFPSLRGEDFAPWVEGADPDAVAGRWREGLGAWGLGPPQLAELRDRMDLTVFTPGSDAGVGVDVLASLARPDAATLADAEARAGLVSDIVSGLLGLVGREADPVRDPAHIVLSRVLDEAWAGGEDLDLEALILRLIDPPFKKVGVFPTDRFFPPDARMDLAMALNGVIASPTFAGWTRGRALDMPSLLRQGGPRVPVSVFYLAHLSEPERQFFLSLLLGRLQAWTRAQPGTEQLRGLLFFDEVAGYLPPHPRQPPTKGPLLMMMKQARAMGLGVVLATQNPVDLDYKALSNAGLWAIGRLRTAQDRERVLKGLPGEDLDRRVEELPKRHFLIARAAGGAEVVGTRHAMCFLRGPFTRVEITRLTGPGAAPGVTPGAAPAASPPPVAADPHPDALPRPPDLGVPPRFLDPRVAFSARMGGVFERHAEPRRADGRVLFRPALHAELALRFDEEKVGFIHDEVLHRVFFPLGEALSDEALHPPLEDADLLHAPPEGALFAPLPAWVDTARELAAAQKRVVDEVYRSERRGMFVNAPLKLHGRSGEDRAAFDARCREAIDEGVDAALARLQEQTAARVDRLEDRLKAKEAKLAELEGVARGRQAEEWLNIGETVLSLFSGRRRSLGTALGKRRQTSTAQARVGALEQEIEDLQGELAALAEALEAQVEALRAEWAARLSATEEREVGLERNDIVVRAFTVLWVPVTRAL